MPDERIANAVIAIKRVHVEDHKQGHIRAKTMGEEQMRLGNRSVLFVVNDLGFFLSHRLPLALGAQKSGYRVAVATPDSDRVRELNNAGIEHVPVSMTRSGANPMSELRTVMQLARVIAQRKPDVLHLVTIKPVIYGGLAARIVRAKAVVYAIPGLGHVFASRGLFASVRRVMVRVAYKFALGHANSRAIFQNPDDLQTFVKHGLLPQGKTRLIPGSGVDPDEFDLPSIKHNEPPVVLLACRMLREKGVFEFIDAARIVKRLQPNVRFILAGDVDTGNPSSLTADELRGAESEGVVEWLGFQTDIRGVLEQSTIACLPSYAEGLPKSLIEAASCRRPIVTTNVPGCRDIVNDGRNGLLVPPRDAGPLAEAILKLVVNPGLARQMGEEGRAKVLSGFTVGSVVEQTARVYEEVDRLEASMSEKES